MACASSSLGRVIRLRRLIDRGRRHPVVGPLLVLVLVLLIAFAVLHEGHESAGIDAGVLCIGVAVILMVAALIAPPTALARVEGAVVPARAPPRQPGAAPVSRAVPPGFLTLRL